MRRPSLLLPAFASMAIMATQSFDHSYAPYAEALAAHVTPPRVDYASLKADRGALDRAVAAFDSPAARDEPAWTREQRMAFWINAYNAFTLRVIVDHYPIRSRWFTLQPRDSIRQIDGVWTTLSWRAAGRTLTLDDIEHRILRPTFRDARVHFALNCASVSCPPLASAPYRASTLDQQLDDATRAFLAGGEGARIDGDRVLVSSLFKWYGEDFVPAYAPKGPEGRDPKTRAILGVLVAYGPPPVAARAREGRLAIGFLDYDWSLNDVRRDDRRR